MINENSASEWLLEQYKIALDESNIVSISDTIGNIEYVNDKFCQISGYTKEELLGKNHNIIRHPSMSKMVFKDLWETITHGRIWKGVIQNLAKDGSSYMVDSIIMPIKNSEGAIVHYIGIRHDISELMHKDKLLEKQTIDDLTGLYNRVKLLEEIEFIEYPTLSIIDIDGFGEINDFYGLKIGDILLKAVATRLRNATQGTNHSVYRLHSDEFAILSKENTLFEEHIAMVLTLLADIKKVPFILEGQKIYVSATSGTATETDTILGKAHIALKVARREKKFHELYNPVSMSEKEFGFHLELANKIRDAIVAGRIIAYYQPIFDVYAKKITKYEALVRLIDNDGAIMPPNSFLTIAKKTKQYTDITKRMIALVAETAAEYPYQIAVNLSIEDIESSEIVSYIEHTLERYGSGKKIVFELTETEEVRNYHAVRCFIDLVKTKFHSQVAIDDFGSGYSNFEHLLELNFDYLKIDGTIIQKIHTHRQSMVLLEAISAFSEKLGLDIVAEFVSNEEIFEAISLRGIRYAQGYHIGKPITKEEMVRKQWTNR